MKYDIVATEDFRQWRDNLKDRQAAKAIALRLERSRSGNLGDVRSVGQQVSELRIFVGKGYRLYFTTQGDRLMVLLCGGDKGSQQRDIAKAQALVKQLRDEYGTET